MPALVSNASETVRGATPLASAIAAIVVAA
jgi:hypothetical protein